MSAQPKFKMPGCLRWHFLSGHKWWCRACDRETERQFRDVCEAYWATQRVNSYDSVRSSVGG